MAHLHNDTCTKTYVCIEAWLHTCTKVLYGMEVVSDQRYGLVMVTVVLPSGHPPYVFYSQLIENSIKHEKNIK